MPFRRHDLPRPLDADRGDVGPPRLALATAPTRGLGAAGRAEGTATFRRGAVRDCLDTLAAVRAQREPQPGESWTTPLLAERRLLAQVEAIVGLGRPALAEVVDRGLDPDVPDAARAFAALFVLGSAAGDAWLRPLLALFEAAVTRHPDEMAAAAEALGLAPNPAIDAALVPLLAHDHPRVRTATVRVLAFRGTLADAAWVAALSDTQPAVVAAAAWAPVHRRDPHLAAGALAPLFAHPHDGLAGPALRAGLALRLPDARWHLVRLAHERPAVADALHLLALTGDPDAAAPVAAGLSADVPAPEAVRAAGALGRVEVVPALVRLLARDDVPPALLADVRLALWKLTGLAIAEGDDAAAVDAAWRDAAPRFAPGQRYRAGLPFGTDVLVTLLREGPSARAVRQDTYFELCVATGSAAPRFNAYDFVAVQVRDLDALAAWCGSPAGRAATAGGTP